MLVSPPIAPQLNISSPFDRSAALSAGAVVEDPEGGVKAGQERLGPGKCARARWTPIFCAFCGREFTPTRTWQQCCSGKCRAALSREREADRRIELVARFLPDDPRRPE